MSSFGRLTFAFCVPFTLVALLSMENGVAADRCRDCSVRLCDHPCANGVNTACRACHSTDVPRECPGCRGRKRREAIAEADAHMDMLSMSKK